MNEARGNTGLARVVWRSALVLDGAAPVLTPCAAAATNSGGSILLLLLLMAVITSLAFWYVIQTGLWFEWRVERIWKAVCAGLGGNFEGEINDYRASVREGLRSRGKYNVETQKKVAYPKLRQVHGNAQAFTAYITPFGGQTVEDYNKKADAFAFAFQVSWVSFEAAPNGLILMRCGEMQVPEVYEPVIETTPRPLLTEYEAAARALLQGVPMAVTINGIWGKMPIEGRHWLIAGRSGSGKGSFIWKLVGGLELRRRAGLVRLIACDPKRVELGLGKPLFEEYADTVESIVEKLEKAGADLDERNSWLQGRARKFTPSRQTPLNVIIIDELAYVSSMLADKKLATRAETAMKKILALGRSGGYSLVGCAQDPRKETLAFRDYFHYRIALGLDAAMVDLVLGEGMQEAGAHCEQIPLEGAEGTAYIVSETNKKPVLVRAPWWSDEAILPMARRWVGVHDEPQLQAYEHGYVPQLGFNGQKLSQFRYPGLSE